MSHLLFDILVVTILCLIGIQDLKERAVSTVLFPLLWLVLISGLLSNYDKLVVIHNWMINGLFLLFQLCLLFLYFSLKNKKITNLFGDLIGWGDLLFWVVISVYFTPANFVFFFLSSLVFSLAIHFVLTTNNSYNQHETIPLAGLQAVYLTLCIMSCWLFSSLEIYDDTFLLNFLTS